jgi:hypothetical protein
VLFFGESSTACDILPEFNPHVSQRNQKIPRCIIFQLGS